MEQLESILNEIEAFAAERGALIYNLCFRNAGVGLQWWEESRVKIPEPVPGDGESLADFLHRKNAASNRRMEQGKVIYRYYPDLRACLEAELERLRALAEVEVPSADGG